MTMLFLVVAVLVAAAPAPIPPPPTTVAAASLLRAADDVERKTKDDAARATLAKLKKDLKEPTVTSAALIAAANTIVALAPEEENVQLVVLEALMVLAPVEPHPLALQQRIRALGTEIVERNRLTVRGHDLFATALMQQGDEEGQLRVLAACGDGCRGRFLEAQRVWQRVRCFDAGLPGSVTLRMGDDVLASSDDIAFIEPLPPVAATPTTPGVAGRCLLQLEPTAAARVAARSSAPEAHTLFLMHGIALVSDTLDPQPARGAIFVPAAACARICKSPRPRALPVGLVVPSAPDAAGR